MKRWLLERFLPMWAKKTVLEDNRRLQAENQRLQEAIRQLECYIEGLRTGLRTAKRKER